VETDRVRLVFSGDLGNSPAPIIGNKEPLPATDYCLIESTYGDRIHEDLSQRRMLIEDAIEETVKAGGVLMIPAFAMERSQQLLFEINNLMSEGRVPKVPVFLDSPLAIKLTKVYKSYRNYFSKMVVAGVDPSEPLIDFPELRKTLKTEESKAINNVPSPKIIIAGSGMMHAGRILHHLKRYLPDPKSMLLIVGFQAEGSLGRRIYDGESRVKIHGEQVSVRAKVKAIGGYSAHADQPQLLEWLRPRRKTLKKVFVVQGEEEPSLILGSKIRDELLIKAEIPEPNKVYVLK